MSVKNYLPTSFKKQIDTAFDMLNGLSYFLLPNAILESNFGIGFNKQINIYGDTENFLSFRSLDICIKHNLLIIKNGTDFSWENCSQKEQEQIKDTLKSFISFMNKSQMYTGDFHHLELSHVKKHTKTYTKIACTNFASVNFKLFDALFNMEDKKVNVSLFEEAEKMSNSCSSKYMYLEMLKKEKFKQKLDSHLVENNSSITLLPKRKL